VGAGILADATRLDYPYQPDLIQSCRAVGTATGHNVLFVSNRRPSRRWTVIAYLRHIPSARPTIAGIVAVLITVLATVVPYSSSEAGPRQDEQVFVAKINQLRASKGLPTLIVDPELTGLAQGWANTMAADDTLKHAPNLAAGVSANWNLLGENVGLHYHHDLDVLFQAFIDSPGHYENLVDPQFTHLGVGVTYGVGGKIWTTHRFMGTMDSTATTTTATAPTTTAPPTTATPPTTTTAPSATPTSGLTTVTTRPNTIYTADLAPATTTTTATATSTTIENATPIDPPTQAVIVASILSDLEMAGI